MLTYRGLRGIASLLVAAALVAIPARAQATTIYYVDLVGGGALFGGDPDGSGSARLTMNLDAGEICWQITVSAIQSASWIGIVNAGGAAEVELDTAFNEGKYQGCKSWPADTLIQVDANPSNYYLRVETSSYPNGAIGGPIQAGVVVADNVHVGLYVCPPGITTYAQANALSGGFGYACKAVGPSSDLPSPPSGYHFASPPIAFPLDFDVTTSDASHLDIGDSVVSGGALGDTTCNPSTLTCGLMHYHALPDVPVGATSVSLAAIPAGNILASVEVFVDGGAAPEIADLAHRKVSMTIPSGSSEITVVFIANAGPTVVRQSGADRYATAAAVSKGAFATGVPVVYIAVGTSFPDALGAGPAAAKLGGPILLVTTTTIPSATATELTRLKPAKIVVVGGTSVISPGVLSALAAMFQ